MLPLFCCCSQKGNRSIEGTGALKIALAEKLKIFSIPPTISLIIQTFVEKFENIPILCHFRLKIVVKFQN